ncbi:ATP-grasp domain-containing protein [Corallococcus exiguus]|uniref:ATP-grasp domain-containing protein n=1 Tax=Corallococcus exiguus TaxID=83462 RepID=UPI003211ACEF
MSTMIRCAFIQELGSGRMEPEMRALLEELRERQIAVETFTAKQLSRGQIPLARDALVAGDIPTVLGALKQLGIDAPETHDYPPSLSSFLHRRVWRSTVRDLKAAVLQEAGPPVFAKPHGRRKRFTGHVFASVEDLLYLERASVSTEILCSEVVRWQSEFRVFVVQGTVVGTRHYGGDPAHRIDEEQVRRAVQLDDVQRSARDTGPSAAPLEGWRGAGRGVTMVQVPRILARCPIPSGGTPWPTRRFPSPTVPLEVTCPGPPVRRPY